MKIKKSLAALTATVSIMALATGCSSSGSSGVVDTQADKGLAVMGDTITYDLSLQLRKRPVYGDDRAQGKSEELKFATDQVLIDQIRALIPWPCAAASILGANTKIFRAVPLGETKDVPGMLCARKKGRRNPSAVAAAAHCSSSA